VGTPEAKVNPWNPELRRGPALPSRRAHLRAGHISPRRHSFYVVTTTAAAVKLPALHRVNDQFLLSKKLQRTVPFGINGVPEAAVNRRKHGDDRAHLMVVGRIIDLLANRKLRHRELLSRNRQ